MVEPLPTRGRAVVQIDGDTRDQVDASCRRDVENIEILGDDAEGTSGLDPANSVQGPTSYQVSPEGWTGRAPELIADRGGEVVAEIEIRWSPLQCQVDVPFGDSRRQLIRDGVERSGISVRRLRLPAPHEPSTKLHLEGVVIRFRAIARDRDGSPRLGSGGSEG